MSLTECRSDSIPHHSKSLKLGLAGFYQSGISLMLRWHRYRMAINDLRAMDNRLLKDIGINRSCVDEAADAFIQHYRGIYKTGARSEPMASMFQTTNAEIHPFNKPETVMDAPHSLAIVAHDLRNPLACIVSSLELLDAKRGEAGDKTDLIIRRGLRAAERIDEMLRGLLEEMRHQHNVDARKNSLASVRDIVETVVDNHLSTAERKSIAIAVKGEDCLLDVNEELLAEALDNLLSNAVKYSQPGSEVICEIIEHCNAVTLQVTDLGPGLTPDDLRQLGRPFQILSAMPTGGEKQTGLGLWAVDRIANLLGAEFFARSKGAEKGAVFGLRLIKSAHQQQSKQPSHSVTIAGDVS